MAMPRNIRLLWRVWGAVLTAVTVGVVALTAWAQITEYRHGTYERVQPGVYGAELLSAESRESTTVVYRIPTPAPPRSPVPRTSARPTTTSPCRRTSGWSSPTAPRPATARSPAP